ncbi:MAG: peptide-methionine (R)-S-oxide reductase MsrB [Clostridia bacterium]
MKKLFAFILSLCLLAGVPAMGQENAKEEPDVGFKANDGESVIYLAGGCFWGMEKLMSVIPGVEDAVSGYANGTTANPTYAQVCTGKTGHRETVRVVYKPDKVSLEAILSVYFSAIDPTVKERQGNDVGSQYQVGVYYEDAADKPVVERVMEIERARHDAFYVESGPLTAFYEAEKAHQDYLDANPSGYCHIPAVAFQRAQSLIVDPAAYRKPSDESLKQTLTGIQYAVTQQSQTERPYDNEYWQETEDGLYVDVTTGEPLFSSKDKYESSCGWPAFGKGLDENSLFYAGDHSHGMSRTEVRSRVGNAHLGHVFEGDRESPTGTRYCINSAALRFVPYDQMEAAGYGAYMAYVRPVKAEYHKIGAEEAKAMIDRGALVVDVRNQSEYDAGHLPNARLIPLDTISASPPALLPDLSATTLIYCRSGRRSKEAAERLVAMGYTAIYDFGGIIDWPYEIVQG